MKVYPPTIRCDEDGKWWIWVLHFGVTYTYGPFDHCPPAEMHIWDGRPSLHTVRLENGTLQPGWLPESEAAYSDAARSTLARRADRVRRGAYLICFAILLLLAVACANLLARYPHH